ncbi:hypothetical protein [Euzebya tangerina]|uniref:hypothetical protein n=1 Tax=Euzebya tangerina TaxID=591198 RepID=UPI000E3217B1|nr:hypothetical protein [Euzebya tangerina]
MDRTRRTELTVWIVSGLLLALGLGVLGARALDRGREGSGEEVMASEGLVVSEDSQADEGTEDVVSEVPTASPSPGVSDNANSSEPTPSAAPSATPEPTETEPTLEEQLEELRASDMWLGLAEWDRVPTRSRVDFLWGSTSSDPNCQYGPYSNEQEVWNDFAPQLRDDLLRMVIEEGIQPESVRYRGLPIQDDFLSGVLGWWTNGEGGSQGRGSMFIAVAAYQTAEGEPRVRQWPVLVGHGIDPSQSTAAFLRDVGPVQDLSVADVPPTYPGANEQFNEHHLDWLFDQEPINPPMDPPRPC